VDDFVRLSAGWTRSVSESRGPSMSDVTGRESKWTHLKEMTVALGVLPNREAGLCEVFAFGKSETSVSSPIVLQHPSDRLLSTRSPQARGEYNLALPPEDLS
jgi:hypothetical protein